MTQVVANQLFTDEMQKSYERPRSDSNRRLAFANGFAIRSLSPLGHAAGQVIDADSTGFALVFPELSDSARV